MADYRISGVWKDGNGLITHYAIHAPVANLFGQAEKKTKNQVLSIFDAGNTAKTWIWNYTSESWDVGQTVNVIIIGPYRYLRTDKDNIKRDNLNNLINVAWFMR